MIRNALVTDSVPGGKARMTVDEFLAWFERQPAETRHELVDGHAVEMQAERVRHALVKAEVWRLPGDAVIAADLPCTTTSKLAEYMGLDSVRHYLVIDPETRLAYHHSRACAGGDILARIVTGTGSSPRHGGSRANGWCASRRGCAVCGRGSTRTRGNDDIAACPDAERPWYAGARVPAPAGEPSARGTFDPHCAVLAEALGEFVDGWLASGPPVPVAPEAGHPPSVPDRRARRAGRGQPAVITCTGSTHSMR